MALKVSENNAAVLIADKAYYFNSDKTKVVEEGDPDAAWLLVGQDSEIAVAEAEKYGLKLDAEPEPAKKPATKRHPGPSEDK